MKLIKKIVLGLLVILVAIQFIRPGKNISAGPFVNSIDKHYPVPKDVQAILKRSCYDCHSNNTYYPWYNNIQPVAWLLAHDVNEGKEDLNFDEFSNYSSSQKREKFDKLTDEVKDGEMPMSIYTVIHRDAVLSEAEKQSLITWANGLKGTLN
ncbi:MAG TPA: heme-binding domain-containing protein [Mucilaginibacter sp.]|nr:heme-binding domain-containing protein [Mucilaginibacter sp.]